MQPPRVYTTPAIVLRQRKLGETDKILTLYTANLGKIDAVAKGVRKAHSRLAGHVEPLTQAMFQLAKGKTLDVVTQVEAIESFLAVRSDLERMSRGLYACELLDRFTEPRAESFALYRLLLDTLRRLAKEGDADTPLRHYEMKLIDALGYRPELEDCVGCRARIEPGANYWSASAGGVVCPRCRGEQAAVRPLSLNALKVMRVLLHGSYGDAARISIDATLADELERCLREYVRWSLERDVRSAAFIDTLRRRPSAAGASARPPVH